MENLEQAIRKIAARASSPGMNEMNTRVLLIEPLLEALGWDTADLTAVTREYRVFDGSFLDYALLDNGKPLLFVEAKALGSDLTIPKWVAQTINYANNEGVPWCVLTDGLRLHVYKTNEPVEMARKRLFEADLTHIDDADQRRPLLQRLSFLSRESLLRGDLNAWGTRLFDDARVRDTLERLFSDPPSRLVALVRSQLPDGKGLSPSAVKDSLQRVGGRAFQRPTGPAGEAFTAVPATPVTQAQGSKKAVRPRQAHTYEEHFGDKPRVITDLYDQFHSRLMALGEDVECVFRAQYVGYRIGKETFCSVIPQKGRLRLVLPLDPATYAQYEGTRDISGVGHWGVGDMEASLDSEDQLDLIMSWVGEAAAQARAG